MEITDVMVVWVSLLFTATLQIGTAFLERGPATPGLALATARPAPPATPKPPGTPDQPGVEPKTAFESQIRISISPKEPFIERKSGGQLLNFDFILENLTEKSLRITRIDLTVLDGAGKVVLKRTLDERGYDSALNTIPDREIGRRGTMLLYNPFYEFDSAVPLTTLRYSFALASSGKNRVEAVLDVAPVAYQTKTRLILPLRKRFLVRDGHDFYSNHRRFDYLHPAAKRIGVKTNFMRYAYDACVVSERGEMVEGNEDRNENWLGFGVPVFATAAGKVVAASDGKPDDRDFDESDVKAHPIRVFGNYVVLDHRNGEFSLYGHLQQGSLKVREGETVRQGQLLAKVGASGSARTPHLHYELRTGADLNVEGLPSTFTSFRRILGGRVVRVPSGRIDTGDIVEAEVPVPARLQGKAAPPAPGPGSPGAGKGTGRGKTAPPSRGTKTLDAPKSTGQGRTAAPPAGGRTPGR